LGYTEVPSCYTSQPRSQGFSLEGKGPGNEVVHEPLSPCLLVDVNYYSGFSILSTRGVLLGSFGGGVPPASPNPDPISDQKMPFPTPVFRPDLVQLYVIKA